MAGVPASVIPTPVPVPRTTKKSSFDVRTVQSDEIAEFTRQDRIDFKVISHRVVDEKYSFSTRTTAFKTDTSIEFCLWNSYFCTTSSCRYDL